MLLGLVWVGAELGSVNVLLTLPCFLICMPCSCCAGCVLCVVGRGLRPSTYHIVPSSHLTDVNASSCSTCVLTSPLPLLIDVPLFCAVQLIALGVVCVSCKPNSKQSEYARVGTSEETVAEGREGQTCCTLGSRALFLLFPTQQ